MTKHASLMEKRPRIVLIELRISRVHSLCTLEKYQTETNGQRYEIRECLQLSHTVYSVELYFAMNYFIICIPRGHGP